MKKRYEQNHFKAFSNSVNKKKLYKKGKNWIIGSLTLLALTGMDLTVQQDTHADTVNNTKANTTSIGSTDDIEHKAKALYTSVVAANITNPSTGKPTQNSSFNSHLNSHSVATQSVVKNSVSSSASKVGSASVANNTASSLATNAASSVSIRPHLNSAYQSYMNQMGEVDANVEKANTQNLIKATADRNVSNSLLGTKPVRNLLQDDGTAPISISSSSATTSANDTNWIWYSASNSSSNGKTVTVNSFIPSSDISGSGFINMPSQSSGETNSDYENSVSSIVAQNINVEKSVYSNGNSLMANLSSIPHSDSNKWIYASDAGFYTGTYRYNKALNAIEFLKGTIDDSGKYSEPSFINNAQSIKFDNVVANGYGLNSRGGELNRLFAYYPNLKSIDVSGLQLSPNIRYLTGLFEYDDNLLNITFGKANNNLDNAFNTSNVISMDYMFAGDSSMPTITFPSTFDTTGVLHATSDGETYYGELGMFLGTDLHQIVIDSPNTIFEPNFYDKTNKDIVGVYLDNYENEVQPSDYKAVSPWHIGSMKNVTINGSSSSSLSISPSVSNLETGNALSSGTYYNDSYYSVASSNSSNPNINNEYRVDFHTSINSNGQTIPLTNIANQYNKNYKPNDQSQLDNQPVSSADDGYVLPAKDFNKHILKTGDANGPGDEYGWAYATSNGNGHYHILQPNDTLSFDKNKVANLYVFPMYQGLIYIHGKNIDPDNLKNSDGTTTDGKTIDFLSGSLTKALGFMNNSMDSDDDDIASYHPNTIKFGDDVYTNELDQKSISKTGFNGMFKSNSLKKLSFGRNFWTGDYTESDMFNAPNLEYITISSPHTKFGNTDSDDTGLENYPADAVADKQGTWYDQSEPNQEPVIIKQGWEQGFNPNAYISSPDGTPNVWTANAKLAKNVRDKIHFVVFGNEQVPVPKPNQNDKYTEILQGAMNSDLKLTSSDIPAHYSTTDSISDINKSIKYDRKDHTIQLTPNEVSYKIYYLEPLSNNKFKSISTSTIDGYYIPNDTEYPSLPSGYTFNHKYDALGGPVQDLNTKKYGYNIAQNGDSYNVYVNPARVGEIVNYVVNDSNANNNGQEFSGFTRYGTSYISGSGNNASFAISESNSSYNVIFSGINSSANVPAGYKIISDQSLSNLHYSDDTKIIYIMPNSAKATINYNVSLGNNANSTVGSEVFNGNSYSASGAGNNSSVLTSANFHIYNTKEHGNEDLVNYWNLVSPSTNIDYTNNSYDVNVTPIQATDTINYRYNNNILAKQNFTGNDYQAFGYSADNDVLNVTSANDTDIPKNYSLSSSNNYFDYISGSNYYVDIVPDSASTTVQYTYNGNTITSDSSFKGNSIGASGALNSSTDITSFNDSGIPQGYHLDLIQTYAPYDNQSHQVAIVPDSVNVHYIYNHHTISQQLFTGNQFSQNSYKNGSVEAWPALPKGYHLSNNANQVSIRFNNSSSNVNIVPDSASTTIQYDYDGGSVADTSNVVSNGNSADAFDASNTSTDITSSNDSGIPNGYHLDLNNTDVPYDNANNQDPHQIAVVPDSVTVNYQYNGRTLSQSTYTGNQFSQASLNGNQFTVTPSLVSGYSVSNGNGYILNNSAITIPFSSNAKEVDVSLSYDFTPTQSSANTNASDVSKANNSVNSSEAWLSSASSINALASGYAASADKDTNSSAISSQFAWDNNDYQQISSLAKVINSVNGLANSYANDISNASANYNVSKANDDLSNTASELVIANNVTSQAKNILSGMTTTSAQQPTGSVVIQYVDVKKNGSVVSASSASGTVGTAVPLTVVGSVSGYIDQDVGSNDGFTFNSGNSHYIDINVVSDQEDPNVRKLMQSSASTSAFNTSVATSTSASKSASSALSSQSISDYSSGSVVIDTANSIIESLITSASSMARYANNAEHQATSQATNNDKNNVISQSTSDSNSADVAKQSVSNSTSTSASTSASTALASQSSSDYKSGSNAISTADSIIISLVDSASVAVNRQSTVDYTSAKNAMNSLAKYADDVEHQAVSQATDNDQSNVSSQSTSDSNSANTAKQSVSNSTSASASSSADTRVSSQNNRDVNEAVYNENYLISLINSRPNSESTESSSNNSESGSAKGFNSSANTNISSGPNSTSSSASNKSNVPSSSTASSVSPDLNSIKTSLSNSASLAVQSVANSASASASEAVASALANTKNNESGSKVITSVVNHTIYVPSVVTKYVGSSTVSNGVTQTSSASVSSSSGLLNLNRRKNLPSHRSAEGINSMPVNSDLKSAINRINFDAPAISVRNAEQLNGVLNRIDVGQVVNYHGIKITRLRVPSHFRYFMVIKTALAHLRLANVGRDTDNRLLKPHHALTIHIDRIIVVHGKHGNYVRYGFRFNHHNFWVTGRNDYTPNAYLQKGDFAKYHTPMVKVIRDCCVYTSPRYSRRTYLRDVHVGTVLPIKHVIFIGRKGSYQTRLQLTNGNYVTANKNFVKVVK